MSGPITQVAAQHLPPVEALRRFALETLSEFEEGYCLSLKGFLSRCGARIHPEIVRGIMADLRQDGLVAHCRGLMTEDGEMAGSGWGITPAGKAHLRALPSQQAQGVMLPDDISAALRVIGRAEWGAVPARPDAEHVANFAKTLRITREHFSTEGPQELHGVYVAGSDVVICQTGTSPNSGVHARAIVGAWNWLLDTATAQQEGA